MAATLNTSARIPSSRAPSPPATSPACGHQDRDIKFCAAICLQEASSTGDVSPYTPDAAGGAGFELGSSESLLARTAGRIGLIYLVVNAEHSGRTKDQHSSSGRPLSRTRTTVYGLIPIRHNVPIRILFRGAKHELPA